MTAWQALHLGRCFSKAVVQAFWWAKRLHGFGSGRAIGRTGILLELDALDRERVGARH